MIAWKALFGRFRSARQSYASIGSPFCRWMPTGTLSRKRNRADVHGQMQRGPRQKKRGRRRKRDSPRKKRERGSKRGRPQENETRDTKRNRVQTNDITDSKETAPEKTRPLPKKRDRHSLHRLRCEKGNFLSFTFKWVSFMMASRMALTMTHEHEAALATSAMLAHIFQNHAKTILT